MKMHKEDLIKARVATQKLLSQTLKELVFSIIALTSASILTSIFFPEVMTKMIGLVAILMGLVFGIVYGVARAYNIFWDKTDFNETRRGDKKE